MMNDKKGGQQRERQRLISITEEELEEENKAFGEHLQSIIAARLLVRCTEALAIKMSADVDSGKLLTSQPFASVNSKLL